MAVVDIGTGITCTHLYVPTNEIMIYVQFDAGKLIGTPLVLFPEMYGRIKSFLDAQVDFILNFGSAVTGASIKSGMMGFLTGVPVPHRSPDQTKLLLVDAILEQSRQSTPEIPQEIMQRLVEEI